MTMKTASFDAMAYLDTPQDHIDLLNDALATGEPRVIIAIIGQIARARGIGEVTEATGVGRSTLYKALADDGNPTIETLMKILSALKIELRAATRLAA